MSLKMKSNFLICRNRINSHNQQEAMNSTNKHKNQLRSLGNPQHNFMMSKKQISTKNDSHALQIKNYQFKINCNNSLSQNRFKKRKLSILSNIYRPLNQNKKQNELQSYINTKNIILIKQNIQKLQTQSPNAMSTLFKNLSKNKLVSNNHSFLDECKTQRIQTKKFSFKVFLFQNHNHSTGKFLTNRRFSRHFDRDKYFKSQNQNKDYQNKHSNLNRRQQTQYYKLQNIKKYKQSKFKIQANKHFFDEQVPEVKPSKTIKPKTAGGFMKKYQLKQLCQKQNFQIRIDINEAF